MRNHGTHIIPWTPSQILWCTLSKLKISSPVPSNMHLYMGVTCCYQQVEVHTPLGTWKLLADTNEIVHNSFVELMYHCVASFVTFV